MFAGKKAQRRQILSRNRRAHWSNPLILYVRRKEGAEAADSESKQTCTLLKSIDPVWDPHEDFEFMLEENEVPIRIKGEVRSVCVRVCVCVCVCVFM